MTPIYGYLYNFPAVVDVRNLTSAGWNIPSDSDWTTLSAYLGGDSVSGGKLKEIGLNHWVNINETTDDFGFNALPGGSRSYTSVFANILVKTAFWSLTSYNSTLAWSRSLSNNLFSISPGLNDKKYGFSVRCVRNATGAEQLLVDGTACAKYTGNNGFVYNTVKIGTQVWTSQNLCETMYRTGVLISNVTDSTTWSNLSTGGLCSYNNYDKWAFENKIILNSVGIKFDAGVIAPMVRFQSKITSLAIKLDMGVIPPKNYFRPKINEIRISLGLAPDVLMGYQIEPYFGKTTQLRISETGVQMINEAGTKNRLAEGFVAGVPDVIVYNIGDLHLGGKIAYVDESGQHGFVAVTEGYNNGRRLGDYIGGYADIVNAKNDILETNGVYGITKSGGRKNTDAWVVQYGAAVTYPGYEMELAAYHCSQLTYGGATAGDWYLPSKGELNQVFTSNALGHITPLGSGYFFWSSTWAGLGAAWAQDMFAGTQQTSNWLFGAWAMVAIRAF